MGAASSFPAILSKEHAQAVVAKEEWPCVELLWPEDKATVTREELEAMVAAHPEELHKLRCNWDEVPVGGRATAAPVDEDAPTAEEAAAKQAEAKKKRPTTARRRKFDSAEKRRQDILRANGVVAADEKAEATPAAAAAKGTRPSVPRPAESAEKKKEREEQSAQLRELMRAQRKAARAAGKPPSGAVPKCEIHVKSSSAIEVLPVDDATSPADAEVLPARPVDADADADADAGQAQDQAHPPSEPSSRPDSAATAQAPLVADEPKPSTTDQSPIVNEAGKTAPLVVVDQGADTAASADAATQVHSSKADPPVVVVEYSTSSTEVEAQTAKADPPIVEVPVIVASETIEPPAVEAPIPVEAAH